MQVRTFLGGVRPYSKKITQNNTIEIMPIPKMVIIPLLQHTGMPSQPIVEVKTKVKAGTRIGEIDGRISSNIHSSIAGIVRSIEPCFSSSGAKVLSVTIESDGTDEMELYPDEAVSPAEIIKRVEAAGIVGMGGGASPTYIKLTLPKDKSVNTIILNGCESEPYLTVDSRLIMEKTREIFEGAKLIMSVVGAKKCCIGIGNNKIQNLWQIKAIAKEFGFYVHILRTKYPQGEEKQLISVITGRKVPSGGLPCDVGVSVYNIGTVYAIYEACKLRKPLIERVVTVTGRVKQPKNVKVRIGTLFKDVIEFCGGYSDIPAKIIMGGPMMGIAQADDNVSVIKATSGILVQNRQDISLYEEYTCIRCGACVSVCPMGLIPSKLGNYVEKNKFDEARKLCIMDCMECGSCAYICPSKRNLVHLIKYGKIKVKSEPDKNP
ncbi:MAG: electron transport complex subunit RsxC [bacterium]|nr:electron transport complex subunit RsxC [bacterium]